MDQLVQLLDICHSQGIWTPGCAVNTAKKVGFKARTQPRCGPLPGESFLSEPNMAVWLFKTMSVSAAGITEVEGGFGRL